MVDRKQVSSSRIEWNRSQSRRFTWWLILSSSVPLNLQELQLLNSIKYDIFMKCQLCSKNGKKSAAIIFPLFSFFFFFCCCCQRELYSLFSWDFYCTRPMQLQPVSVSVPLHLPLLLLLPLAKWQTYLYFIFMMMIIIII